MSIYKYQVEKSNGEEISLSQYRDNVLLIVNTATKCGFANQFEGLEELHQKYQDQGLRVLGFPSNQFNEQEPVDDDNMEEACKINFGVTFPLFKKIDVKGPNAAPLFKYLTEEQKGLLGSNVKWNFTKFLVDRNGNVVKRFAPKDKPAKIENDIKALL
ncbi:MULTISPECIES: glutathione peroxidase [Oceanobacillus]|uniref:Glutathione peroxidase n=1 Tax=Oceanobacillus kimchii TaxID=746691 RepID=A0ABQ5TG55_9BACI|nr:MULTISPECIES: glutathione peroxidase [Oceanobacillus]MBT2653179.1 glutathione peroxidase [Oceanobacillus sp. ISL-73]GLO64489.1 glutathione peroxidase homolog BsaA [Oceanobacillus kimchii]